jgi:hypothetical protein
MILAFAAGVPAGRSFLGLSAGVSASGQGEFHQLHGIAMDSQGRIFVADSGNDHRLDISVRPTPWLGISDSNFDVQSENSSL